MDMSGAMIAVMAVMMLAMIGGLIWGLSTALRTRLRGKRQPEHSAREILDRRYASGEITSDEYDEQRRKLENDRG
jgi:uncharacterized membrane protein